MKITKLSIIIPVYNEWNYLEECLKRVNKAKVLGLEKEIILVDDGSTDGSGEVIKRQKGIGIRTVLLGSNHGKGYAIRQGLKEVTGQIVLIQDADLEYDPWDYERLLQPIMEGETRVVYGSRELTLNTHSSPWFYLGGSIVTEVTNKLFGGKLTDVPTGYKVFVTKVIKNLPLTATRFEFCPEVTAKLLKKGEKIVEVPIRYQPRHRREGKKIRFKDAVQAVWTLVRIKYFG